jgi:hypothetical protein
LKSELFHKQLIIDLLLEYHNVPFDKGDERSGGVGKIKIFPCRLSPQGKMNVDYAGCVVSLSFGF